MIFVKDILRRFALVIQFLLVFLFILFEEIVWEGLAEPIYEKIQSLKILQRLQLLIKKVDRYTLLVIFLVLLLGVEGAGVVAGLFLVQGKVIWGGVLYMLKIPIAGFTFWLFKISKDKLLSFHWFAWSYEKLISGIEWLKSTDIYQTSMDMILSLKSKLKEIKKRLFSKESSFWIEIKAFYRYIKNFKHRKR